MCTVRILCELSVMGKMMPLFKSTPMCEDMLCFSVEMQYYAESHGVIYVIDSTDEERLTESKDAFGEYPFN